MHAGVVRQLLLASSSVKQRCTGKSSSVRNLQQRCLQLAVLRGNDANDSHSVPLKALLVDAAGTLISPSEPVAEVIQPVKIAEASMYMSQFKSTTQTVPEMKFASMRCQRCQAYFHVIWLCLSADKLVNLQIYLKYAREYGCTLTEQQVLQNFRRAFSSPWTHSLTRYVGDGRPFW